jgi:DNA-binding transcriptional regulator YhcF (GntR family)
MDQIAAHPDVWACRPHINRSDPMPLYAQLERAIRLAIATEKLSAGDQLPTVRQLAVDLRVNANNDEHALRRA